jgi:hypothetical protein
LFVGDSVVFFFKVSVPWFAIIVTLFGLSNRCSIIRRRRSSPGICCRGLTPRINWHSIPTVGSSSNTFGLGISRSTLLGLKFRTALIASPALVKFLVRVTGRTIESHGIDKSGVEIRTFCLSRYVCQMDDHALYRDHHDPFLFRDHDPRRPLRPEGIMVHIVNKIGAMCTCLSSGLFHRQQEPPLGRPESSLLMAYPREGSTDLRGKQVL